MRPSTCAIAVAGTCLLFSCVAPAPRERDAHAISAEGAVAQRYASMLDDLRARGALDTDSALQERVRAVSAMLARVELRDDRARCRPPSWEIHTAERARMDAIAMPGGKLLVGAAFARRFASDDGELAVLVGHEMGHVLACHRRFEPNSGFESGLTDDLRSAERLRLYELEADAIGIDLALRAGWPARAVVSFYEKLVGAADSEATFSATHPSARERLERARARASVGAQTTN